MNYRISQVDLYLDDVERTLVSGSMDSRWLTEGPHCKAFQARLSELTRAKHVFFAPNGTLALFLAALALSLALAKTAEAHQGGRRLETVFIDEGFGSLDAETLDYALTALHSLRDEGRVVGVISHVEEMQRTIPVQLRLLRRGETTTTEIVGLPGP